ncbi:hypothetical protein LT708_25195 [Pseudomonas syringae pv. syringae]|uniref:hypothetical protein n=1 Tax=Pseudomonas syringae TaxID=317 RepID=UPI00200B91C3|nr:hypothetical protein [Pseudomonas syringae]MCK9759891.1 hypothetical protein [Pseudomonas syringae pv. syringae]MCK9774882.1 hypothetical protein [Pseudomonas syringae pv. syringae]
MLEIKMPSIAAQQEAIFEQATMAGVSQMVANLKAPRFPGQSTVDESTMNRTWLLRESEGYEPPPPEIIEAYFRHFQQCFSDYSTDEKLAKLLGLSSTRRVREYKKGERTIPYGVWRTFLVITGRVPQDIIKVLAFMA